MTTFSKTPLALALVAMMAAPASLSAQELAVASDEAPITVYGNLPDSFEGLPAGPEIDGFISARSGNQIEVTTEDGQRTSVAVGAITDIRSRGGFLGLGRTELSTASLLNGLPVTVETVQWSDGLLARTVRFSGNDLETAEMIRGGTAQQFAEHDERIEGNTEMAEALRGRVANIDQYNIMGTTNVYFDTGRWNLSPAAQADLCNAAAEAGGTDNALLLVVGYTDDVGDQDFNQTLSERRAGRVVNFLQQECDWAPWRMLTPTGMSEADPEADNSTAAGRAMNRRVAVNILVSRAVEGM